MAEYISFQPTDFFNSVLYTGNDGTNAITGVGFQPDITWIKKRSAIASNSLHDVPRGADKTLRSNTGGAQTTNDYFDSFDSDGFTVSTGESDVNANAATYVGWNWKAETTTGIVTTGSTITPTAYAFNQTAGCSIITYTGNTTAGATIPHGLGVAPDVIWVKNTQTAEAWSCQYKASTGPHSGTTQLGPTKDMTLNDTNAQRTVSLWNDTAPDAVNFVVGSGGNTNLAETHVAYCWADIRGYSKSGIYGGNSSADGPFIFCGFRPAMIIIKKFYGTTGGSGGGDQWQMFDNKRVGYNEAGNYVLNPSANAAEQDTGQGGGDIWFLSNGFKAGNAGELNEDDNTYLYQAFAEFPLVSSNDVPTVAR